jgi:uridine kinase
MTPESARDQARAALDLALSRPPTLGAGRLLSIDGPSGGGKSTLAAALRALAPRARVLRLDDLYDGWHGLAGVGDTLRALLEPLALGTAGSYRRYDWLAGSFGESVAVEPVDLLVLDGVGSGHRGISELLTALVWVDVDREIGRARALARDMATMPGADAAAYEEHLRAWQRDEAMHYAVDATRERADIVLG